MKASSLKGIAIVDLSTAERIGRATELVIDVQKRLVLGIEIRGDKFSGPQVVLVDKIHSFGRDAVTISDTSGFTERANIESLQGKPTLDEFIGTKIVTEGGDLLGSVKDLMLSDDGRQILEYEYSGGGFGRLFGLGTKRLPATANQRYGKSLLTVPNSEVAPPPPPSEES